MLPPSCTELLCGDSYRRTNDDNPFESQFIIVVVTTCAGQEKKLMRGSYSKRSCNWARR